MEPNQAAEDKIKRLQQSFLTKQALRFGDDAIKANFPYDTMTPEEFVARRSHAIGVFSYAGFQYHDQAVKEWVHKVAELLSDGSSVEECRRRFLDDSDGEGKKGTEII